MECDELFRKLRENLYPSKIHFVRGILQTGRCEKNFLEKDRKMMVKCMGDDISEQLKMGFWNLESKNIITKCYNEGLNSITEKLHVFDCSER
jgi:hypothetical protein